MKNIILSALLIASVSFATAQGKSTVFSTNEIVWYGLDFTKAKFVGQFDQGMGAMPAKGYDMKVKWVPQWNSLIAKEPKNFDLRKAMEKENIIYDLEPVNTVNSKMDKDDCMSFNAGKIEKNKIDYMIEAYPRGEQKNGIGCVFIVENFNKNMESASVYVTFFDIASKKVLLCEKMEGKPMGVGMRNYWAGAIKAIIKQIGDSQWSNWKG